MASDRVTLAMGAGGKFSSDLIALVFLPVFGNKILRQLDDSAELSLAAGRYAFTTDSYTIQPIFFPGGDIGKLSIAGTVNDLAAKGARPLFMSVGFIIEEGFLIEDLKRIVRSMQDEAAKFDAAIVTGDTKVVARGEADGIFINTTGIGSILEGMTASAAQARPGDDIIISGTIAEHGLAILNERQGLGFEPKIQSDVTGVFPLIQSVARFAPSIHAMRDPTRGGVAAVVNEIARASRVTMVLRQKDIPIRSEVGICCELLGLDPLSIANEGKLILFCDPKSTPKIVNVLHQTDLGKYAAVIGKVEEVPFHDSIPPVTLETAFQTRRFVLPPEGEQLPRIC